jgi:hypothetical protein
MAFLSGGSLLLPVHTVNSVQILKACPTLCTMSPGFGTSLCTVRVFRQKSIIGGMPLVPTPARLNCSLQASRRVTNGIPLGCPRFYTGLHCKLRPNPEGTYETSMIALNACQKWSTDGGCLQSFCKDGSMRTVIVCGHEFGSKMLSDLTIAGLKPVCVG